MVSTRSARPSLRYSRIRERRWHESAARPPSSLRDDQAGWRPWIDLEQAGLAEQLWDGNTHLLIDQRRHRDVGQVEFPGARRIEQADLGQGQGESGSGPDGRSTGR